MRSSSSSAWNNAGSTESFRAVAHSRSSLRLMRYWSLMRCAGRLPDSIHAYTFRSGAFRSAAASRTVTRMSWEFSSIPRHGRIDFHGPTIDPAGQVPEFAEAGGHQELHRLRASDAGAAVDHDVVGRGELVHAHGKSPEPVSYTHLRAHETDSY